MSEIVVKDGFTELDRTERIMSSFGSTDLNFVSSFSPEQALEVYDAISDTDTLRDHYGEPLTIVDYVVHSIEVTDIVSGEVIPAIRTVLVTDSGEAYATCSMGVANSLRNLLGLGVNIGGGSSVTLMAKEVNTRSGRRTTVLKVVKAGK